MLGGASKAQNIRVSRPSAGDARPSRAAAGLVQIGDGPASSTANSPSPAGSHVDERAPARREAAEEDPLLAHGLEASRQADRRWGKEPSAHKDLPRIGRARPAPFEQRQGVAWRRRRGRPTRAALRSPSLRGRRTQTKFFCRVAARIAGSSTVSKPRGARFSASSPSDREPRLGRLRDHRLVRLGARAAAPRSFASAGGRRAGRTGGEETLLRREVEIEDAGIATSIRPGQGDAGVGLVRVLVAEKRMSRWMRKSDVLRSPLIGIFALASRARRPRRGRPSAL